MKNLNGSKSVLVIIIVGLLFSACRKRDALLPDNLVSFETTSLGMAANENSLAIRLKLSRNTDREIPLTVKLVNKGVVYATDYTTSPAVNASGEINLVIPSGSNETSITINKVPGVLYDGDESIAFEIYSSGSPVLISTVKQFTVSFAELIASSVSSTMDGGGALFPNKVFVDLSANRQHAVLRTKWDLGFYTGADDFRVILNSSTGMMAKQINKDDLNSVTSVDTLGFSNEVVFSQTAPTVESLGYIDYPSGDLNKTAIAPVSATVSDNKVYIINRGTGVGSPAPQRGWKKVRIIRNGGGGYTLQHADINATAFTSVDIVKDETQFFKYISFETGTVDVEPGKSKWDFAWTYFSNVTNFGAGEVPYLFQDIIISNRNVEVARVMEATKLFDAFNEAALTDPAIGLEWKGSQNAIGADWRSGGGPGVSPATRSDRYYIVRDGDNNYYKVRFTALTKDGERGYPAYEAVLVKKGG